MTPLLDFAELTGRTHLARLENDILGLTIDLQRRCGCSNLDLVCALVAAAQTLARRDDKAESFEQHLIGVCARNLGRIRASLS